MRRYRNMASIELKALGIGALRIGYRAGAIYVDAFIEYGRHPLRPFDSADASAIVVTHDHGDHFSAVEVAAAARRTGAVVVGPPSVAYPLLAEQGLPPERLRAPYDQDPGKPVLVAADIPGARISAFSSRHFHDGDNMTIHNSYLIELEGKRIFVTGDSDEITRKDPRLYGLDALVYNLVSFEDGIEKVGRLESTIAEFSPELALPFHLVDCDWTLSPDEVRAEAAKRGLASVVVLDAARPGISI
jgi:L-ascorbate metabolism protein UlaG (beta-lactamase superfamily)